MSVDYILNDNLNVNSGTVKNVKLGATRVLIFSVELH